MAKPGPKADPTKAKRPLWVRPHVRVERVLKERADALGVPWSDYISYVLAHALSMPECAPRLAKTDDENDQGVLPLKDLL